MGGKKKPTRSSSSFSIHLSYHSIVIVIEKQIKKFEQRIYFIFEREKKLSKMVIPQTYVYFLICFCFVHPSIYTVMPVMRYLVTSNLTRYYFQTSNQIKVTYPSHCALLFLSFSLVKIYIFAFFLRLGE